MYQAHGRSDEVGVILVSQKGLRLVAIALTRVGNTRELVCSRTAQDSDARLIIRGQRTVDDRCIAGHSKQV